MSKKKSISPIMRDSRGDKIFRFFNGLFLCLLALIVLYPVYFIVIASFSDPDAVLAGKVVLWPVGINLEGYQKIMERTDVWQGYYNTIVYTLMTVVLSLLVTIPAGWALSRKTLPGKKFLMMYFIIPMFFGGGLIPFYNVMSSLGLINTIWAIVLPSILSVWNLFMTKTFFESSIPGGLIEAAKIDGAGLCGASSGQGHHGCYGPVLCSWSVEQLLQRHDLPAGREHVSPAAGAEGDPDRL